MTSSGVTSEILLTGSTGLVYGREGRSLNHATRATVGQIGQLSGMRSLLFYRNVRFTFNLAVDKVYQCFFLMLTSSLQQ